MKTKIGDEVLVTAGVYKGKKGKILSVVSKQNKIVVEKVNIRTRHIKKTPQRAGERIQFEAPFDASKVKVICPHCSKPTRIGYTVPEKGKKYRVCKKCGRSVEKTTAKKD